MFYSCDCASPSNCDRTLKIIESYVHVGYQNYGLRCNREVEEVDLFFFLSSLESMSKVWNVRH